MDYGRIKARIEPVIPTFGEMFNPALPPAKPVEVTLTFVVPAEMLEGLGIHMPEAEAKIRELMDQCTFTELTYLASPTASYWHDVKFNVDRMMGDRTEGQS